MYLKGRPDVGSASNTNNNDVFCALGVVQLKSAFSAYKRKGEREREEQFQHDTHGAFGAQKSLEALLIATFSNIYVPKLGLNF